MVGENSFIKAWFMKVIGKTEDGRGRERSIHSNKTIAMKVYIILGRGFRQQL